MNRLSFQAIKFSALLLACACLNSCQPPKSNAESRAPQKEWPNRRDLAETMREHDRLYLVYGTGIPERIDTFRQRAEVLASKFSSFKLEVVADTTLTRDQLENNPLMVVGSPTANSLTATLLKDLPIKPNGKGISYQGLEFEDRSTIFNLSLFPSPFNRFLPVILLGGLKDEYLWEMLGEITPSRRSFPGWDRGGINIYQNGKRVLTGDFMEDKAWLPDSSATFDFTGAPVVLMEDKSFRVWAEGEVNKGHDLDTRMEMMRASLSEMEQFTGKKWGGGQIEIFLYPSVERKGMMVQSTSPVEVDFEENKISLVWNQTYCKQEGGGLQSLFLRRQFGNPRVAALEMGLAIHFTKTWQYKGYKYWVDRLYRSDNLLPLSSLFDNESLRRGSPIILGAMAGSFVEFLLERWSKDVFFSKYAHWNPSPDEIAKLEKDWHAWLQRGDRFRAQSLENGQKPGLVSLPYLKGFNFAHEGYSVYNGYGSNYAIRSLTRLTEIGSNAVAVIPYAGMRDPFVPQAISIYNGSGSENDEVVIHAGKAAARLGMFTMVKPQLWMGRGYWPGSVKMESEADWKSFFEHYHAWILHYALISEIYGFDLLCIGTELSETTLAREGDWRELIQRIRGIYHGKLTYAANWGREFEQLSFWDDLDYMGLNCYYPLSDKKKPSRQDLQRGFRQNFRKVAEVVEKAGKPLLLTEIGFTSAEQPWINPHEDGRDRENYPEHQRLCYEVAFEEIARHDWCKGIFWWKYPTDPGYTGGRDSICFTPHLKPAEEVVMEWFPRLGDD